MTNCLISETYILGDNFLKRLLTEIQLLLLLQRGLIILEFVVLLWHTI